MIAPRSQPQAYETFESETGTGHSLVQSEQKTPICLPYAVIGASAFLINPQAERYSL